MSLLFALARSSVILIATTSTAMSQTADDIVRNPNLFISVASKLMKWEEPAEPKKIVGPVHFVGTQGLSAWLLTSPAGHILLNTGMPSSGPMIEASVKNLGFDPKDIRLILASHAHIDHVGGHAHIKRVSGATVAMIDREAELLASGGKADFFYSTASGFHYEPVQVDKIIGDGDVVSIGDLHMSARLTAGHSRGSTTWTTTVREGDKAFAVVFADGLGINPGYRVSVTPSYPGIESDYRRTIAFLESVKADIWLSPHNNVYAYSEKSARATKDGVGAWVDPDGFKKYVAEQRNKLEEAIAAERR